MVPFEDWPMIRLRASACAEFGKALLVAPVSLHLRHARPGEDVDAIM